MSLVRAALRIATVEALRPSAALPDGPFPTSAGRHVFDSRIDPIDDLALEERRPVIAVYTEEDNGDPIAKSGPVFYKRIVDVVVEMSVPAVYDLGEGEAVQMPAITDAALEFKLDLLEAQARFALHFAPSGAWFRKLAILPAIDIRSLPHRTSEEGVRLAYRSLRVQVQMRNDDEFDPLPLVEPHGLARLPQPTRDFIASLPADHYGRQIAEGMAAAAPSMPLRVALKTVGLNAKVTAPDGTIPAAANVVASADNLDA
jgi:hypothetical protein